MKSNQISSILVIQSCVVQEKPNPELEDSIKYLAREVENNDDILVKMVPTTKQDKLVNRTRSINT